VGVNQEYKSMTIQYMSLLKEQSRTWYNDTNWAADVPKPTTRLLFGALQLPQIKYST